jgi:hypothetical protein
MHTENPSGGGIAVSGSQDPRSLFAPYASGEIAAAQLHDLEAALREDSDLRREFIEYLNVDSALSDLAALTPTELADIERETTTDTSRKSVPTVAAIASSGWGFRSAVAATAVGATLLLMASVWFNWPGNPAHEPVATLVTDVDALLLRDRQPCSDSRLRAGEYQLQRGLLHLQFADNVMVYVEAPAHFDVVGAARVLLHSGRLSASVPPEGVGFTVETPEAEVVDFGTEFSVDVAGGASEVHVFEGLVRVQPRSPTGEKMGGSVDLRTSQAVMIDNAIEKPVEIELASDRFIRTFDEPRRGYARTVKQFSPVAIYRMAIRDQGLTCVPPEYSGVVLTGDGNRPPHARGVFAGGSLRVLADSIGRGGRVDRTPSLRTGQFTLSAFVYVETNAPNGIVANTIRADDGNFTLALNEMGALEATVRNRDGDLQTVSGDRAIALQAWRHVVMTVDGQRLCLYEDGRLVASSPCPLLAESEADVLWFGTNADGQNLWNGRIDEVGLFDKALNNAEVTKLYQAALEEIGKSE